MMIRFLADVLGVLALKMLLQLAMQDIGQLTDIRRYVALGSLPPPWLLSSGVGDDSVPTSWSV